MMAQQAPEDSIEAASDFLVESIPTEVIGELETVDVHSYLADKNKMKEFISCKNCKQEFDHDAHKPFLLPCLDAICKSCIQEISESQNYDCSKCSCSHICFHNDHLTLQIDNTREIATELFCLKHGNSRLVCGMCTNDQMASHRCFDCSVFICKDCVKLHLSLKTLRSHSFMEIKCLLIGKLKNLGLSNAPKYCVVPGHEKEQLKMHCSDPSCVKNVCVLCAISAHKDHNLCDITKVGKEMETKMETYLKSIDFKVQQANTYIAKLSDINGKYQKDSQQLQTEIKTRFSEARKALKKREKNLCEAVALYLKEKQICIESEQKKMSSFISSCREATYYGKVSSEVNDHSLFVDIANVILPQLEILENQLPEIEVTLDTMTFSSQESSFETAVSNLGKLSVSKFYSPKSKVVVTPPVCYASQQIQFKIQLLSSTENLIVDEDVSVSLKVNGKTYQLLKCAFETSSSSFTGIWIPDKPMKISWSVVSNDIEIQTLNGVIDVIKPADKENYNERGSSYIPDYKTATDVEMCIKSNELSKTGMLLRNADCKPRLDYPSSSTHMKGKTNRSVTETVVKDVGKRSSNNVAFDIEIPMTESDYQAVLYFGSKYDWFRKLSKQITHINGNFVCSLPDLSVDVFKITENDITELFKSIKSMLSDFIMIENKDIDFKKTIQEIEQMQPNVCILWNKNDIEIISDSYTELLIVKNMLQRKMSGKANRRVGRTFTK